MVREEKRSCLTSNPLQHAYGSVATGEYVAREWRDVFTSVLFISMQADFQLDTLKYTLSLSAQAVPLHAAK